MKRQIAIGGQEKEIAIIRQGDEIKVTFDGAVRTLKVLHREGALTVVGYEDDEGRLRLLRLAGSGHGASRQLWVEGQTVNYALVGRQSAGAAPGRASLAAEIPAVVSEVLVAIGATVAAGDALILLESMKMVIPITAPYAGVVSGLHCRPGEAVQPGIDLVSLTALDQAAAPHAAEGESDE